MAQITQRGERLGWWLNREIGTTTQILETASLIARHAVTYNRIQELWTSNERASNHAPTRERLEAKEAWLEARITDLVWDLPQPDDGRWRLEFEGDPRGATVKLIAPNGRTVACEMPPSL